MHRLTKSQTCHRALLQAWAVWGGFKAHTRHCIGRLVKHRLFRTSALLEGHASACCFSFWRLSTVRAKDREELLMVLLYFFGGGRFFGFKGREYSMIQEKTLYHKIKENHQDSYLKDYYYEPRNASHAESDERHTPATQPRAA